jgi:hypothetical protein
MDRIPAKAMPWWEDKLQMTEFKAQPWPQAAHTI